LITVDAGPREVRQDFSVRINAATLCNLEFINLCDHPKPNEPYSAVQNVALGVANNAVLYVTPSQRYKGLKYAGAGIIRKPTGILHH